MHELIGALVYANDMKQALREASRVFSKHTGIDVQDEQGLHSCRYDYFVLLDPQTAVDFAEFRKNILETVQAKVRKGYDSDGKIRWETRQPTSSPVDYSKRFPRHPLFIPVGGTEPLPVPAMLPASDPNARYLMECIMAPVKNETLKTLSELRELLQSKTDEELFNEPVDEDFKKTQTHGENILTYTFRKLWKGLEWYTSLYDHCGFPIRTHGELECILKGNTYAYIYNKVTDEFGIWRGGQGEHSVSKMLSGKLPFDNQSGTRVLLNRLPLWLVPADAHS